MSNSKYIRFDWAAKNILRSKADFVVFEGLISVLVKEKVTIVELLESTRVIRSVEPGEWIK